MNNTTKYVGLDVSKKSIAVAVADEGREKPRYIGMFSYSVASIRKLMKKLGKPEELHVCYEAGPTGYGLYRLLKSMDIECVVVAPSLIPNKPGNRIKTDKRDALNLASLHRAGELTPVYVPTEDDEALRDLVRAREAIKEDEKRTKNRITKFLLRNEIREPEGTRRWSARYWEWLDRLRFERSAAKVTFQEYLQQLKEHQQRLKIFEEEIEKQSIDSVHAPIIQALMTLRGVALITATSLAAEISSFERFPTAQHFMSYDGLVPSESSSGQSRKLGEITKTGNQHIRRLLIESAWAYRHQPAVKGDLKKRQKGQPTDILSISWKAQNRLHKKYYRLISRGKESPKAITAVARELAGFIWAIGVELERKMRADIENNVDAKTN